jgi:di/tricarboxylate transporter
MTAEQAALFALFAAILGMLLWGRYRYDLIAFGGLLLGVVLGLVPEERAFSGFANPAVLIVAFVLIASRAFENSGVLALLTRWVGAQQRSVTGHVAVTSGIAGALSAVINNVAALALFMPLDIEAARKAGRPPGITLMPLAFATILGGLVTLIGTPPNIIASAIRAEQLGQPYGMFDFTPVGLAVAVIGIVFIATLGWRLVPLREDKTASVLRGTSFKAQVGVAEGAPAVGKMLMELDDAAEEANVILLGLIRDEATHYGRARGMTIESRDALLIEGSGDAISAFIRTAGLSPAGETTPSQEWALPARVENTPGRAIKDAEVIEAAVPYDSRLIGRSARQFDLRRRYGVTLLGIARSGIVSHEKVQDRTIAAGDVLLLAGQNAVTRTLNTLGLVPINRVGVAPPRPRHIIIVIGLFMAALIAAATGVLSFAVALAIAIAGYAAFGIVPMREFYTHINWPVIVMLASLLPIGEAFNDLGGTALIAQGISAIPLSGGPVAVLVAVMVLTMMLSDVLNNIATIVIMGPVGIALAQQLGVNPDTFLMGVAISASCAFLTPIGHKNNTLIMGPGGFRFSDYWRLGLCLEIIVMAVAVPVLLVAWPL